MNAHIITVGDEILIGQTMNTNAAYIGSKLVEIQIDVKKTSVVADVREDIINEFKECWQKNDIVIVTGGLGPTHDDLTLPCIVEFFNTKLVHNEDVLKDIEKIFHKRGREVTKVNKEQALVPEIASVIRNPLGTAPGVWIEKDNKVFVAMPGVPFEMMNMMKIFVIPHLQEKFENKGSFTKMVNLQTTGIAESTLFERLGDMNELLGNAKMAFLPSQYGVKLRITVTEETEEEANGRLIEIEQKIRSKAGKYIYAKGEKNLEEVVANILTERGLTISIAESCTGGNVCNLLTNISGSSKFFERGVVSYSNGSKVEILKVDEDLISEQGAVSSEVAMQMAEGVRSISGTDIGLSITGILGPTGGSPNKPVGLVYFGLCDENLCTSKKMIFGDDRILNKQRATQAALDLVRRHLLGINLDE